MLAAPSLTQIFEHVCIWICFLNLFLAAVIMVMLWCQQEACGSSRWRSECCGRWRGPEGELLMDRVESTDPPQTFPCSISRDTIGEVSLFLHLFLSFTISLCGFSVRKTPTATSCSRLSNTEAVTDRKVAEQQRSSAMPPSSSNSRARTGNVGGA